MATTNLDALTLSGALTVTGAQTFTGAMSVDDTTDSTSGTTGSIHTDGGLGVAKDIYAGNDIKIASGGVINFNGGGITITHSSGGKLAVAATWATAAATGRPFAVNLTTNVSLGSYANAFKANIALSSKGGATGLLSAGNFEVTNATTGIAGNIACVEMEMTYGATCGALAKPCFMFVNSNGTAKTDFDSYGDFIKIGTGMTAAAGKILGVNTSTLRVGTGALSATKKYIPLSTTEGSLVLGSSSTPQPLTAGSSIIKAYGDVQASVSSGGSADCIYAHLYVSEDVDITSSAFAFAGHFRLEVEGGSGTTSIETQSAALRTYLQTDGEASSRFTGSTSTIYAECRVGNNTTFTSTAYLAALTINSRTHASATFDGEQQYWGIIMGRTSASYQKFYAAMRLTDCTYLLDIKDDDVMASYDEAATAGTKAGWRRLRFREQGVDRYIRLYDAGN